jgi:hypothetical protein
MPQPERIRPAGEAGTVSHSPPEAHRLRSKRETETVSEGTTWEP